MRLSIIIVVLITLCFSCSKDMMPEGPSQQDFSGQLFNEEISIAVGSREVSAYLSKPQGTENDLVLVLHGGTRTYELSLESTIGQYQKEDGGRQFLNAGFAILALNYTEFSGPEDTIGVHKGYMEMEEVLAAVDFIQSGQLAANNFSVNRFFAFGHSRGGANALLAGIDRKLDGVISTEGPINWVMINDSIQSGYLMPSDKERFNYLEGTKNWGDPKDPTSDWTTYSPALRIDEFQSPFLVIQGYNDQAAIVELAIKMQNDYDQCQNCIEGGQFVLHPNGHTDWALPGVLNSIQEFIR